MNGAIPVANNLTTQEAENWRMYVQGALTKYEFARDNAAYCSPYINATNELPTEKCVTDDSEADMFRRQIEDVEQAVAGSCAIRVP